MSLFNLALNSLHKAPVEHIRTLSEYNLPISKRIMGAMVMYKELCEKSQFLEKYNKNLREDILLSGSVQAGKTNELLFYCWWSIFICRRRVIYMCRNITADKIQLLDRIKLFNEQIVVNPKYHIPISVKKIGLTCILANHHQIKTSLDLFENIEYNLCIDEIDTSIKSRYKNEFKIQEHFDKLREKALHQIGATATEFAVLSTKKTLTSILVLREPDNYYGLTSLKRRYINHNTESSRMAFENDIPNIRTIYPRLMKRDSFFILHSSSSFKFVHMDTLEYLAQHYPEITVFTYNGDFTYMKVGINQPIPFANKKRVKNNEGLLRIPRGIPISEVIQEVKSHPYLCCISGHLAGRGISFVSSDYSRHLTDQYYSPSNSAHGETIIQGIRICGRYNDNPELNLWISRLNWGHITQQYRILKNMVSGIESGDITSSLSNMRIKIPGKRFSRPSIMRGIRSRVVDEDHMNLLIEYEQ